MLTTTIIALSIVDMVIIFVVLDQKREIDELKAQMRRLEWRILRNQ